MSAIERISAKLRQCLNLSPGQPVDCEKAIDILSGVVVDRACAVQAMENYLGGLAFDCGSGGDGEMVLPTQGEFLALANLIKADIVRKASEQQQNRIEVPKGLVSLH